MKKKYAIDTSQVSQNLETSNTSFNESSRNMNMNMTNHYKNILFEYTPRGNVAVFYNNDDKEFQYYSDNSLPYSIIDNVLQKYVVTFHCPDLYNTNRCGNIVPNNNLLEDSKSTKPTEVNESNESNESNKSNKQKLKDKYRNVYANLKKSKGTQNTQNTQDTKNNKNNKQDKNNKNDVQETLIVYHHMKHCGKLRDFDFKQFTCNMSQNQKQLNLENNRKNVKAISYKEFTKK